MWKTIITVSGDEVMAKISEIKTSSDHLYQVLQFSDLAEDTFRTIGINEAIIDKAHNEACEKISEYVNRIENVVQNSDGSYSGIVVISGD